MKVANSLLDPNWHRRWHSLARAAWLFVLLLGLALVVFNIRGQFNQSQTVCAAPPCDTLQFTASQAADLAGLGLSVALVAAYFAALTVLQSLVFVSVAAIIFWRKSDDWLALLTSFTLVAFGIGSTLNAAALPPSVAQFLMLLFLAMGRASIVIFFFLFPDGRFVPGWTRWLAPFAVAREVLGVFFPGTIIDDLFFVVAPLTLLMQVYRYRRSSNAVQRQQTKWVVYGSVLGVGTYASLLLFFSFVAARVGPFNAVLTILLISGATLSLCFIPLSIGLAILRSHLWDIDILIRRTLIYGALTGSLALVYLGVVVALQAVFTALTPLGGAQAAGAARSELVTVLSTLAIAVLFVPLRNRLQGLIDRRFYRRKYDAARILAEFSATLRDEVDLDNLSAHLLAAVDETMQPASVGLWLKSEK